MNKLLNRMKIQDKPCKKSKFESNAISMVRYKVWKKPKNSIQSRLTLVLNRIVIKGF